MTRSVTHTGALAPTLLMLAMLGLPGCFGRTGAEGLGLVDGEEGETCSRDAHCQLNLVCLRGVCGRVSGQGGPDASIDGDAGDPSSCPGFAGYVDLGESVDGTTVGGENRYSATCGGGGAPEDVWVLELSATTDVTITTLGSRFDTVLYVRDRCGEGPDLACNDDTGVGSGISSGVTLVDAARGVYFIYVDGWSQHAGEYQLNVSVAAQADGAAQ